MRWKPSDWDIIILTYIGIPCASHLALSRRFFIIFFTFFIFIFIFLCLKPCALQRIFTTESSVDNVQYCCDLQCLTLLPFRYIIGMHTLNFQRSIYICWIFSLCNYIFFIVSIPNRGSMLWANFAVIISLQSGRHHYIRTSFLQTTLDPLQLLNLSLMLILSSLFLLLYCYKFVHCILDYL